MLKKQLGIFLFISIIILSLLLSSCGSKELSLEEIESVQKVEENALLAKTVSRLGGQPYALGKVGGTWTSSVTNDPKTFNLIVAQSDSAAMGIIGSLYDYLADYDPYTKEWKPNLASYEILSNEEEGTLDVKFTLKDNIYWTNYNNDKKIKVSSDDILFWYNEVEGDPETKSSGYNGQFLTMEDGSSAHIDLKKVDDRSFTFHFPRIIANPILTVNMYFGPKYLFEPAKKNGGVDGMKDLFTVDTDVTALPSIGEEYLIEYTPGVRLVYTRNPFYWKLDNNGTSLPYIEKTITKIVPDQNTELLLFKSGEKDNYSIRPEDLEDLLSTENPDYTVYNGGAALGSTLLSFNQNPEHIENKYYQWFSKKEFRQAMSRLLNRERIIKQVYRGLAEPALGFFATANPYYDETIKNKYTYDPQKAVELLASIGIKPNSDGKMTDKDGNLVEFDITLGADNTVRIDTANIFADECGKIGLTVNVKPLDFQKVVAMLTSSYDWHAVIIGLGSNYWPTQGSNVWPSDGNLHVWNPLQETPVTEWEARVDYLYNEGSYTVDRNKASEIWKEYQNILLEQLPVIYQVHSLAFISVRNKWDNVFYDTLGGIDGNYLFLKDE